MKTIEYRTKDKSEWPRGEWDSEPDKIQWQDEATGLPCLIHRNTMGALCGYVGISPGHPSYEKEYDHADVEVHGCLTYAAFCEDVKCEEKGVCHLVEEGEEEKVWWLGFDCNHAWDYAPGMPSCVRRAPAPDETYKNVHFVKQECAGLAAQLKGAK